MSDIWNIDIDGWNKEVLFNTLNSLNSFLMSFKSNFFLRYDCESILASEFATSLNSIISQRKKKLSFEKINSDNVILILDRSSDLISSLIYTWSYVSIIHEQFQIKSNSISIKLDNQNEKQYIPLFEKEDTFFKENIDCDFGNIGIKLQNLAHEFEIYSCNNSLSSPSIQNLKSLIIQYPLHKSMGEYLSKHVNISINLSKSITKNSLLILSEFEQKIVSTEYSFLKYNILFSEFKKIVLDQTIAYNIRLKISFVCFLKFSTLIFFNRSDFDEVILSSDFIFEDSNVFFNFF